MLISLYCVSLFASHSVSLYHVLLSVVEPAIQALSTRSTNRPPVTAVTVVKDKPKAAGTSLSQFDKCLSLWLRNCKTINNVTKSLYAPSDVRTTRSRAVVKPLPPPSGRERNSKGIIMSCSVYINDHQFYFSHNVSNCYKVLCHFNDSFLLCSICQ